MNNDGDPNVDPGRASEEEELSIATLGEALMVMGLSLLDGPSKDSNPDWQPGLVVVAACDVDGRFFLTSAGPAYTTERLAILLGAAADIAREQAAPREERRIVLPH